MTTTSPTAITATLVRPVDPFGSDWNWADEAVRAWLAAAHRAGLRARVASHEVPDVNRDAAIVEISGTEYVLRVRQDEVQAYAHLDPAAALLARHVQAHDLIKALAAKIDSVSPDDADWGHVGDLGQIIVHLQDALGVWR